MKFENILIFNIFFRSNISILNYSLYFIQKYIVVYKINVQIYPKQIQAIITQVRIYKKVSFYLYIWLENRLNDLFHCKI